jgi:hypothetical protein
MLQLDELPIKTLISDLESAKTYRESAVNKLSKSSTDFIFMTSGEEIYAEYLTLMRKIIGYHNKKIIKLQDKLDAVNKLLEE